MWIGNPLGVFLVALYIIVTIIFSVLLGGKR